MPPPLLTSPGWPPMLKYNTCAHARSGLHPFIPVDDHDPVYPVATCCKKAVRYKVAEPRSYLSAIRDREVCETCTLFTDPDTLMSMRAGTFHADIYMDRLIDLPVTNIRKLFKLLHLRRWENEQAIDRLVLYLARAVQESKDTWKQASADYVNGWRKVDNPKSRHPAVVETLKNNNRLTSKVKTAKTRHERWAKIQSIWAEISAC